MTDFESQRSDVLADRRARVMLAELEAEALGEDAEMVELMTRLADVLRCWKSARESHELARWRHDRGEYTDHDLAEARGNHRQAEAWVLDLCSQITREETT